MTIFELVKLALDELYEEGLEEYGGELDRLIKQRLSYLSASYGNLRAEDRVPINYRDPATRFAYVYAYVAAHADYLVQVLEIFRSVEGGNVFVGDTLRVACVGGGPGSDVVGVVKYLTDYQKENVRKKEPITKLSCHLLDKEQAWGDTWGEIGQTLDSEFNASVIFQQLDVTQSTSSLVQKKFLKSDLFIFLYFVSEVYSLDQNSLDEFWAKIFNEARPGAVFIYIDNGSDDFNQYFDKRWKLHNDVKCLFEENNTNRTPSSSEQKSELAAYEKKFDRSPKLRSRMSVRILQKH